jgi:hypothetical protein
MPFMAASMASPSVLPPVFQRLVNQMQAVIAAERYEIRALAIGGFEILDIDLVQRRIVQRGIMECLGLLQSRSEETP